METSRNLTRCNVSTHRAFLTRLLRDARNGAVPENGFPATSLFFWQILFLPPGLKFHGKIVVLKKRSLHDIMGDAILDECILFRTQMYSSQH
jgi:hypothetical protein